MLVRYLSGACLEILTDDLNILVDPWFTDGAFCGAWHPFPKTDDPIGKIHEPDVICISHIHPDHYDPAFLRQIYTRFGTKPVLCADAPPNYLLQRGLTDGFDMRAVDSYAVGATQIDFKPVLTASPSDLDAAIIVRTPDRLLLNLNDCAWHEDHIVSVERSIGQRSIDLLALAYSAAGPYPQTYFDSESNADLLAEKADAKRKLGLSRYSEFCDRFPSAHHLPFAGEYLLGGRLTSLNAFRGCPDAIEVESMDPKAIVLAPWSGSINLTTDVVGGRRQKPYSCDEIEARLAEIAGRPLDYERDVHASFHSIPFERLLRASYQRAIGRSRATEDYWFVFHVCADGVEQQSFSVNANAQNPVMLTGSSVPSRREPRSDYFIDYRQLFGLLSGLYHWNNSELGSIVTVRREPDVYRPEAQSFLSFLAVV